MGDKSLTAVRRECKVRVNRIQTFDAIIHSSVEELSGLLIRKGSSNSAILRIHPRVCPTVARNVPEKDVRALECEVQ
jgi:hypothetical protein